MWEGSDCELHVISRDVRSMDAPILYLMCSLHPVLSVNALQWMLGAAGCCFVGFVFVLFVLSCSGIVGCVCPTLEIVSV